ncbi:YbhN family protein [Actinoplanes sp. NPDC051859]|uniref:YbhN family protein n=1 Tax=Actinoplanes sp. NPDC051859 TaxID=3363909 RepID=UPI0037AD3E01
MRSEVDRPSAAAVPGPRGVLRFLRTLRSQKWARLLAGVALVAGLVVIGLQGRLPDPHAVLRASVSADYGWIVLAVALQAASIGAFALQQRNLLHGLGVRLRRSRTSAIILAATAISIAVPAGPALSTAYTVREYRRAGAAREIALASVIVSGLASIGGLALVYAGGGLAVLAGTPTAGLSWEPLLTVLGLTVATAATVVVGRRWSRRPAADRASGGRLARLVHSATTSLREAWQAGAGLRGADWAVALGYAAAKWITDLMCLVAAVRALDEPVSVITLAGIYLGVQIVRQVPLTPGGIGVIDTALVAGLTAAGADVISATAAVLIYRLISCWLLIPIGGAAAVALRRARTAP